MTDNTKTCPFCAEEINIDDKKCKHCNSNLNRDVISTKKEIKHKKPIIISLGCLIILLLFFRLFYGIFVIQPIGAIPDGVTIVYWRSGLNLPFVASADGLLEASGEGVSLLGRGILLGDLADPIKKREIFRIGYSETLYLWSTGGKKYEK